jgi:methylmalonyl-CoA mutase
MAAVEVCTSAYHDAGASSVQDLAFLLGTGVEYLRAMMAAGMPVDAAARQIRFSISLGARFWLALAKLRAARLLWSAAVGAIGGGDAAQAMRLRVVTGRRVLTTRAQSVNILRNTVVGYAGALGGADAITTVPFDATTGISTPQSRRNARNTQLILAEECRLNQVIDPAGGSWYVEWYTRALAERAWALFQEIERHGGMLATTSSGWVERQLATIEHRRERDIATRRTPITGISEHPTLQDLRTPQEAVDRAALHGATAARLAEWRAKHDADAALDAVRAARAGQWTERAVAAARSGATLGAIAAALAPAGGERAIVMPLAVHPYDEAFEDLRNMAESMAARGRPPRVHLAGVGSVAEQIARKNFARGFFQAGGFEVIAEDASFDAEGSVAAFAASGARIAVICSTDKRYPALVPELAPRLTAAGAATVVLAGNPGPAEAAYRTAGVDQFIFMRCDVLATLRTLLEEEAAR